MQKREKIRVELCESLSRLIREKCSRAGMSESEYVEEAVLEKIEFEELDDRQFGGYLKDCIFSADEEGMPENERKKH